MCLLEVLCSTYFFTFDFEAINKFNLWQKINLFSD